jgi:hypothetical protein
VSLRTRTAIGEHEYQEEGEIHLLSFTICIFLILILRRQSAETISDRWGMYCRYLVTLAVVEGSYHLSRSGGGGGAVLAAYVSGGTTSLERSVLECGQVSSTLCCLLYITFANITHTCIPIYKYIHINIHMHSYL